MFCWLGAPTHHLPGHMGSKQVTSNNWAWCYALLGMTKSQTNLKNRARGNETGTNNYSYPVSRTELLTHETSCCVRGINWSRTGHTWTIISRARGIATGDWTECGRIECVMRTGNQDNACNLIWVYQRALYTLKCSISILISGLSVVSVWSY